MSALLAVRKLSRAFGGVRAADAVGFDVARGEMVALIGPNGAGKTTTFNLIGGQLAADAGSVALEGRELLGLLPAAIARLGVGRTFQVASTFASMTARENVEVALRALRGRRAGAAPRAADELLARAGAARLADAHAATLAHGDAKLVELAIALAGAPSLLLLDEPAAGIGAGERAPLMNAVRASAREGAGVLFTEHDMDVVFAFADRVVVLDHGRVIADAPPATVRADAAVQRAYLGDG